MNQEKIGTIRNLMQSRLTRPMRYYLDLCTRFGLCYDTCHVYYGIPRREYSPVGRAETVRRIFKKYFRPSGRFFPYWGEARELDDRAMEEIRDAAFSCTGCRRCMVNCPFGIDTGYLMTMAKLMLIGNETAPEELMILADSAVEKGKSIEEFKEGFRSVVTDLERIVQQKLGLPSPDGLIPMDSKGADILYVGLSGAHSIVNPAVIFNAAREKWTLSFFEAVNFGAFLGDPEKMQYIANRVVKEAKALGVKEVVITECGTAYRIPRHMMGELPFRVSSIVEVIDRYMRQGRIRVRAGAIGEPITYHDPCQLGRNGGIFDEPRRIIGELCSDFREMTPNREHNWCCGGGGGLVALDNEKFRVQSGLVKRDQINATGAKLVVTACENCVSQLDTIKAGYGMGVEVKYLTELVADNLVL